MEKEVFLKDEAATLTFGQKLAASTFASNPPDDPQIQAGLGVKSIGATIHLCGDLGAGKTTLARGFLRGFGVQGAIKSPTYTLVEPYELQHCRLFHFDLYRLADPSELEYLGFEEHFDESSVCLIEWPIRGGSYLPLPDLIINLDSSGTGRVLLCQSQTEKGRTISQRL